IGRGSRRKCGGDCRWTGVARENSRCRDAPSFLRDWDASYDQPFISEHPAGWFLTDKRLQNSFELGESFRHAGFDGSLGYLQHLGDLTKLQTFVVPEDENHAIGFGNFLEGIAHGGGAFLADEIIRRTW